jgi:hypothetical protein
VRGWVGAVAVLTAGCAESGTSFTMADGGMAIQAESPDGARPEAQADVSVGPGLPEAAAPPDAAPCVIQTCAQAGVICGQIFDNCTKRVVDCGQCPMPTVGSDAGAASTDATVPMATDAAMVTGPDATAPPDAGDTTTCFQLPDGTRGCCGGTGPSPTVWGCVVPPGASAPTPACCPYFGYIAITGETCLPMADAGVCAPVVDASAFLQSDPCGGPVCQDGFSCGIISAPAHSLACCRPSDFASGYCNVVWCAHSGDSCFGVSSTPEHPTGCCSDTCTLGACQ